MHPYFNNILLTKLKLWNKKVNIQSYDKVVLFLQMTF